MEIRILELLDGARQAEGTAVIIDVFRAFTVEPFVLAKQPASLTAVERVDTARRMKEADSSAVLIGERHGRMLDGFDYGNSPAAMQAADFRGAHVIHTTSAGTQGLAAASKADVVLAGSLVNASATARYIRSLDPAVVSLVCMGWECRRNTEEDLLCAEYLKSLLEGKPIEQIRKRAEDLKYAEGKKFFDPKQADVFPEADFWLCVDADRFDFAVRALRQEDGFLMEAVR